MKKLFGIELLALVFALLCVDGYSYHQLMRAADADRTLGDAISTTNAVRDVHKLLAEAESGQRGFLLTGNEVFLETYDTAVREVEVALDRLFRIVGADNADVRAMKQLAKDKMEEMGETIRLRRYHGQEKALDIVKTDRGRKIMQELRSIAQRIRQQQEIRADDYSKRLDDTLDVLKYVRSASMVLCVVLGGVLVTFYSKHRVQE